MNQTTLTRLVLGFAGSLVACGGSAATEELSAPENAALAERVQEIGGLPFDIDWQNRRIVAELKFAGSDGKGPVRFKSYRRLGRERVLVIFVNGRGEFSEKYDVLFTSLHEYPYGPAPKSQTFAHLEAGFFQLDPAGQGGSVANRTQGHIDSYKTYVDDLRKLVKIVKPFKAWGPPLVLMGHSMGGLIATRFAQEYPDLVDGLVLSSPLFQVKPPPGVAPELLVQLAGAYALPPPLGFGLADRCAVAIAPETLGALAMCMANATCAPCVTNPALPQCPFIGLDFAALGGALQALSSPALVGCPANPDPSTCDPGSPSFGGTTFDRAYCEYSATHPLLSSGPTFGWLLATFQAVAELNAKLPRLTMPVLVLSTPIDPIVVPEEHVRICDGLPDCTLVQFPPSAQSAFLHELLAEVQRGQVLTEIRSFIGDLL